MKGIVFTEFLDLVETNFGNEMVAIIIQESKLPNDGAYTSVGTHSHGESPNGSSVRFLIQKHLA